MSSQPDVYKKINALPDHVQEQLSHYVDFLYEIYRPDPDEINEPDPNDSDEQELTESGKTFLEVRVKRALANPDKWKHWREVTSNIHEKHGWPNL